MTSRRSAFTLIEVGVSVGVIALLAGLSFASYSVQRATSRDAAATEGARTYSNALNAYSVGQGTFFVTGLKSDGSAQVPAECIANVRITGIDGSMVLGQRGLAPWDAEAGVPEGCVGANGLAYGRVTTHETPSSGAVLVNNGDTVLARRYGRTSIAQALRERGYLSGVVNFPGTKGDDPTNVRFRNFNLIRCCPWGQQSVGTQGQLYMVAFRTNRPVTSATSENVANYCGGLNTLTQKTPDGEILGRDFGEELANTNTDEILDYGSRFSGVGNAAADLTATNDTLAAQGIQRCGGLG